MKLSQRASLIICVSKTLKKMWFLFGPWLLLSDMILGGHISSGKASVESINEAVGGHSEFLSRGFWGLSPLREFRGSKDHLDWLKIDLNAAKIITVPDYKCTKN